MLHLRKNYTGFFPALPLAMIRPIIVVVAKTTRKMRISSSGDVPVTVLAELSGAPWSSAGNCTDWVFSPGGGATMKKAARAIPTSMMTPAMANTAFAFAFFCCIMNAMI